MNFKNLETTRITVKNLTFFAVLFLGFLAILIAQKTSSAPPTQDCSSVAGTPQAGDNCLYFYPLPLCSTVPRAGWIVPSASILGAAITPNHRVNCADLADLPLCSQLEDNGVTGYPLKNCVKECSDPSITGTGIRGSDYAVHNRDCIRFCSDALTEEGITPVATGSDPNCVAKNCHQLTYDITNPATSEVPNEPANCNLLPCNLLTTDELNEAKFGNSATMNYEYCEKSDKCLEFTKAQLPYLIPGNTCKMHDCRVACIDNATDDVQAIKDKGTAYTNDYQTYINSGNQVGTTSDTLCKQTFCKPIVQSRLRCTPMEDAEPTTRNDGCDPAGTAGGTCSGGYCYKTIDCNKSENTQSAFCLTSDTEVIGTTDDSSIHSWFYRPKPMDSATNGSGVPRNFNVDSSFSTDGVCYSKDDMLDNRWGEEAYIPTIFGRIYMGYWHPFWENPRSPRKCDTDNIGLRGTGMGYLCGMDLNIYNIPNSHTAYHSGYVETTFTDTEGTNVLSACLRFDAGGAVGKSCGKRECQISCALGDCSQICGSDECVNLVVKNSDPYQCAMTGNLSDMPAGDALGEDGTTRDCMKTIDGYIRLRAVKYGDYICTFVDARGTTAYDPVYFNGSEKIALGGETPSTSDDRTYCFSGTYNEDTESCSGGKNTNDDKTLAERWRTLIQVPYVQSNQPSDDPQGYLDKDGRLFPEQGCIKAGQRITVPALYNLANMANSPRIFVPPLYILNASTKRDGTIAVAPTGQVFGDTDFHYPEMTVSFGAATQKLSLGFAKTGYEVDNIDIDPKASATMTTTLDGQEGSDSFSVEVSTRKEYEEISGRPTFCLYQKVKDMNGVYLNPQRIGCVYRKYPEIDNSLTKLPSDNYYRLVLASDVNNTYLSSKIVIRYLSSAVANDSCGSATASCTTSLSLGNDNPSFETCDPPAGQSNTISTEQNKICVRREECSKLNNECIQNEIALYDAQANNQPTASFTQIQTDCNEKLLPLCNSKFGITASDQATIINPNPSGSSGDSDAYGWFNELCITQGFEKKKRRVVAKLTDNGLTGKCVIDEARKKVGADCSAGGKKPDCPCLEFVSGVSLGTDRYYRLETSHEAGLCIDVPLPQVCPAINHNPIPNSDKNDLDYITSSLLKTAYGTTTSQITDVVHISHKYRTYGLTTGGVTTIPIAGHAEFPQSIFGFNNVRGSCTGFWTYALNGNGVTTPPTMSCLNSGGTAVWGTVNNQCVRYSCSSIYTSGIDANGNYQGGYQQSSESGEDKGLSHGFANWPLTSSDDFPVTASATSCIVGFKQVGATTTLSSSVSPLSPAHSCSGDSGNLDRAALYSCISGYSGGTAATRQCSQRGKWQSPTTNCQRISCSAISPPSPSGSDDTASWELWNNSGGATFPSVNAARSATLVDGSTVKTSATSTGTCNNSLGFFQIVGGSAPTRVCDYLGNWGPVQNACITQCDAVSDSALASTISNGYAYWYKAINVPLSGELLSTTNGCGVGSNPQFTEAGLCKATGFKGCVSGYATYPYPPLRSAYGKIYELGDCTTETCPSGTIPNDVNNDTRIPGNPERYCKSVDVVGGQANVWTSTSSTCVNSCPGYDIDARINVGKTQHPVSSNVAGSVNGIATINWPTTAFGQTAYVNSPNDITTHDGSQYYYGRANGYYSLSRYCNSTTHKWDPPIPYCATNSGQIKVGPSNVADALATYNSPTPRVAVGSSTGTGTCISGSYSDTNGSTTPSAVTCSYKDSNNKIDETYFNTGSVKKCNPMCRSKNGTPYGTGSTDAASGVGYKYYAANSKLSLSCISNYGSKTVVGSSVSNSFNDCGRYSEFKAFSDRSPDGPYVTCDDNGNGTASWSSIFNDCTSCRSCTRSTAIVANNNSDVGDGDNSPSQSMAFKSDVDSNGDPEIHFYSDGQQNCGRKDYTYTIETITNNCRSSSWFDKGYGSCVRIGFTRSDGCDGGSSHSDTNAYFELECADGVFIPNTNNCGSNTNYNCW